MKDYDMKKLHICIVEIFRLANKIIMFADNWDTRDPCSPDYEFINISANLIKNFDKQIHDELFTEMIAKIEDEK